MTLVGRQSFYVEMSLYILFSFSALKISLEELNNSRQFVPKLNVIMDGQFTQVPFIGLI